MSRKTRYRDPRAHKLAQYGTNVLVAASGVMLLNISALAGSEWSPSSFHYTIMAIDTGLSLVAIALHEAARRIGARTGGLAEVVARPPLRWTPPAPAAPEPVFHLPRLPQPRALIAAETTSVIVAAPAPVIRSAPVPVVVSAPAPVAAAVPTPSAAAPADQAPALAAQP